MKKADSEFIKGVLPLVVCIVENALLLQTEIFLIIAMNLKGHWATLMYMHSVL